MIDRSKVRQAFRAKLLPSSGSPIAERNCAWENRPFDPSGLSVWLRESLLVANDRPETPAQERMLAIMQYDIFVPDGKGSEAVEELAEQVGELFQPASETYSPPRKDGVECAVDGVDIVTIKPDGVWAGRSVRISFRAYSS